MTCAAQQTLSSADVEPVREVMTLAGAGASVLQGLAQRYGVELVVVPDGEPIPASYWGDREAGLRAGRVFARLDTPLHSVLHELAHYVCMDDIRRRRLDGDAGGDFAEEDAVCYLQVLLADAVPGCGRARICSDMDTWGYTFRLGSAGTWFERDAAEAAAWLREAGIVDGDQQPTWCLRDAQAVGEVAHRTTTAG